MVLNMPACMYMLLLCGLKTGARATGPILLKLCFLGKNRCTKVVFKLVFNPLFLSKVVVFIFVNWAAMTLLKGIIFSVGVRVSNEQ